VSSFGVVLPLVLGRRFTSAFFLARTFGVRTWWPLLLTIECSRLHAEAMTRSRLMVLHWRLAV
jgi:hypothetical protein